MPEGLTYRAAGVDIDRGDAFVEHIRRRLAGRAPVPGLVAGVGGFASLWSLKESLGGGPLDDPLLVSGTDGVGTKLKLAFRTGRHDTVGVDLVAMCVNDVITTGAKPLFFLDYFGTGRLELEVAQAVVDGIVRGAAEARVTLVGGETAELPGLYAPGEYDLAGFAVGVVERRDLIDGRDVRPGDVVLGLASTGVHSNGFSLAQMALFERRGLALDARLPGLAAPLAEVLLTPTRLYTDAVRAFAPDRRPRAIAHITGGGIAGNLPRVLPDGLVARVAKGSWPVPPIFGEIAAAGVAEDEMYRTFNMGLGLMVVVEPSGAPGDLAALAAAGYPAVVVGEIAPSSPGREAEVVFT